MPQTFNGQAAAPPLYGWAGFLLVVVVATRLFGPVALMVLAIVAGGALIVTGARSTGWPRPFLTVVGALLMLTPVFMLFLDVAFGEWVVTVR